MFLCKEENCLVFSGDYDEVSYDNIFEVNLFFCILKFL